MCNVSWFLSLSLLAVKNLSLRFHWPFGHNDFRFFWRLKFSTNLSLTHFLIFLLTTVQTLWGSCNDKGKLLCEHSSLNFTAQCLFKWRPISRWFTSMELWPHAKRISCDHSFLFSLCTQTHTCLLHKSLKVHHLNHIQTSVTKPVVCFEIALLLQAQWCFIDFISQQQPTRTGQMALQSHTRYSFCTLLEDEQICSIMRSKQQYSTSHFTVYYSIPTDMRWGDDSRPRKKIHIFSTLRENCLPIMWHMSVLVRICLALFIQEIIDIFLSEIFKRDLRTNCIYRCIIPHVFTQPYSIKSSKYI